MNLLEETQMLLNQYGLRANKKLGQNFLINEEVIAEIVEKSEVNKEDLILEIGPGLGSLTKTLLEKAGKVIAIELDANMINLLKNRFLDKNLEIIQEDILKVDIKKLIRNHPSVKVVANLPYYITTPILMKLLEEKYPFQSITVMVQKEVGERICAKPGNKSYGAITLSANYYSVPKKIIDVPKENFLPSPEVDSCVIKLDILQEPPVKVKDEKQFFGLIRNGFNHRRKTITNSLASDAMDKGKIISILHKLQIAENLRAEDLSLEDFAKIANEM